MEILLLYLIHKLKQAFEEIFSNYLRILFTFYKFLGTKKIEDKLFAEIRGRIKEEDVSAPLRKGPYYYYTKTLEGKEYVQRCRRLIPDNQKFPSVHDIMPTGPEAPREHVILDENIKAQQHAYYRIGSFKVIIDCFIIMAFLFCFFLFCFLISNLLLFYFKMYYFSG